MRLLPRSMMLRGAMPPKGKMHIYPWPGDYALCGLPIGEEWEMTTFANVPIATCKPCMKNIAIVIPTEIMNKLEERG